MDDDATNETWIRDIERFSFLSADEKAFLIEVRRQFEAEMAVVDRRQEKQSGPADQ